MTDSPATENQASPGEAPSSEVAVFVDSNGFLQAKDLKDADWRALLPAVLRVEIMVVPAVIAELDAKKTETKDRIRKRARAALHHIDAASDANPMRLVLKERPVVVALNVPHVAPIVWRRHAGLDPSRPDDQLIAQALETETALPKIVLTHDSGPRIAARRAGLTAMTIPASWLLPDPVDDDRKKLQRLQRENEALKSRVPHVTAAWSNDSEEPLVLEQLKVPSFSAAEIELLVAATRARSPQATATFKVGSGFWIGADDARGGFSQRDIDRYAAKYEVFTDQLSAFFEGLPRKIASSTSIAKVDFRIDNVGSATAEG